MLGAQENLGGVWRLLDEQQRDVVAATLALLEALEGADDGWAAWALSVIRGRVDGMDIWRRAIAEWGSDG